MSAIVAASAPAGALAFLNPAGTAGGNIFAGLVYLIVVAIVTVVIGGLYVRETYRVRIWDEVGGEAESGSTATVASGDVPAAAS